MLQMFRCGLHTHIFSSVNWNQTLNRQLISLQPQSFRISGKPTLTNKCFKEFFMYFHSAHIERSKVTCVPCDIPLTLLYCLETRKQSTAHETIRLMKVQQQRQQQQHCRSATCLYHQQTPQARVGLIWGCVTDTGARWDWFSPRLFALQRCNELKMFTLQDDFGKFRSRLHLIFLKCVLNKSRG